MRAILVWRVLIAGICGLLISSVCLNFTIGPITGYLHYGQNSTARRLRDLNDAVQLFKKQNRALPSTIAKAYNFRDEQRYAHRPAYERLRPVAPDWMPFDVWRRPIIYRVQGNSYTLASLGRDGKPGGVGLDCDLTGAPPNPARAAIPLAEVLLDPLARGVEIVSLICGVLVATMVFQDLKPSDLELRRLPRAFARLLVMLGAALIVALIVTGLHIPSGH